MHRHGEMFWSATFGTTHAQGVVCMIFVVPWRDAIVHIGIVVGRRAHWMLLQWGEIKLGFLNLYAPNQASA